MLRIERYAPAIRRILSFAALSFSVKRPSVE
jgi:hypothetical protein